MPTGQLTRKCCRLLNLTVSYFLKMINKPIIDSGCTKIYKHNCRSCGATYFLGVGLNQKIVQMVGGWSSDTFDCYWCDLCMLTNAHLFLFTCTNTRVWGCPSSRHLIRWMGIRSTGQLASSRGAAGNWISSLCPILSF